MDWNTAVDDAPSFPAGPGKPNNHETGENKHYMSGAIQYDGPVDLNLRFKGVSYQPLAPGGNRSGQFVKIHPLPTFRIQAKDGKTVTFQSNVQVHFEDESGTVLEETQGPEVVSAETVVLSQEKSRGDVGGKMQSPNLRGKREPAHQPVVTAQVIKTKKDGKNAGKLQASQKVKSTIIVPDSSPVKNGKKAQKKAPAKPPTDDSSSSSGVSKSSSKASSSKSSMTSIQEEIEVDVEVEEPAAKVKTKVTQKKRNTSERDPSRQFGVYDPAQGGIVMGTPPSSPEAWNSAPKDTKSSASKKVNEKGKDGGKAKNKDEPDDRNSKQKKEKKSRKGGSDAEEANNDTGSKEGEKKHSDEFRSKSSKHSSSKSTKSLHAAPQNPYMSMYSGYGPQPPWGTVPPPMLPGGGPWSYPQPYLGQQMPIPQYGMPGYGAAAQSMPGLAGSPAQAVALPAGSAPPNEFDFSIPPPPEWMPPGSAERAKLVSEEAPKDVQAATVVPAMEGDIVTADAGQNKINGTPKVGTATGGLGTVVQQAIVPAVVVPITTVVPAQADKPKSKAGSKTAVQSSSGLPAATEDPKAAAETDNAGMAMQADKSLGNTSHSSKSLQSTSSQQRKKVVYLSKDDRYLTLRFNVAELKGLGNEIQREQLIVSPTVRSSASPSHHSTHRPSSHLALENLAIVPALPVVDLLKKTNEAAPAMSNLDAAPSKSNSKRSEPRAHEFINTLSEKSKEAEVQEHKSNTSKDSSKKSHVSDRNKKTYKVVAEEFEISIEDRRISKLTSPASRARTHRTSSVRPEDSISQVSSREHGLPPPSHHKQRLSEPHAPQLPIEDRGHSKERPVYSKLRARSTIHPWESISQVSTSPGHKHMLAVPREQGSNAPTQGGLLAAPTTVSNYKSPTVESVKSSGSGHKEGTAPVEHVHISVRRVRNDSPPSDLRRRMDGSGSEPHQRSHQSQERDRVYSQNPRFTLSTHQSSASSRQRSSEHSHRSSSSRHSGQALILRHEAPEPSISSSHHSIQSSNRSVTSYHVAHSSSPHTLPVKHYRVTGDEDRERSQDRNQDRGRVIVRVRSRHFYERDPDQEEHRHHRGRLGPQEVEFVEHNASGQRRTFVRVQTREPSVSSAHSKVETIASEDSTARRRSYRRPEWL